MGTVLRSCADCAAKTSYHLRTPLHGKHTCSVQFPWEVCGDCTATVLKLQDFHTVSTQPPYGYAPTCDGQEMAQSTTTSFGRDMDFFGYGKRMLRASLFSGTVEVHKRRLKQDQYFCESGLDQDGFQKKFISNYIGYGVFTTKTFAKGDFLLEYVGERISEKEAMKREKQHKNKRCYMYFFRYMDKTNCVDATKTIDRICHFVNDAPAKSSKCNSKMKLKVINNYPRLCLYASRDIREGEEIRYDYGDDEKNLDWRKQKCNFVASAEKTDEDPFDLITSVVTHGEYRTEADENDSSHPFDLDKVSEQKIEETENTISAVTHREDRKEADENYPHAVNANDNIDNEPKPEETKYCISAVTCRGDRKEAAENNPSHAVNANGYIDDCNDNEPGDDKEKNVVVTCTALCPTDLASVQKLLEIADTRVKILNTFRSDVTHIIVKTDPEGSRICSRTLKYFQGIVHKCWILDMQWVIKSLAAGFLVPEDNFEIMGDDVTCEDHNGPYLSRTSNFGLFSGYTILLHGFDESGSLPLGQMQDLIESSGGKVEMNHTTVEENILCILAYEIDEWKLISLEARDAFASKRCVSYHWLLDSITQFKIRPFEDYYFDMDVKETDLIPQQLGKDVISCSDHVKQFDIKEKNSENEVAEGKTRLELQFVDEQPEYSKATRERLKNDHYTEDVSSDHYCDDTNDVDYDPNKDSEGDTTDDDWDMSGTEDFDEQEQAPNDHDLQNISESEDELNEEVKSTVFPQLSKSLTVQSSGRNSKGNLDNKKHVCVYCEALMPNISRHLSLKHKSEVDVAKILTFPKRSKERRKMWEVLVNKGDYAHNYAVMERGHGQIIPKYRSQSDQSINEYVPCQFCRGFYKKPDLWKHQKVCNRSETSNVRFGPIASGKLLLPQKENVSRYLQENVLVKMKEDEIKMAAVSDDLILTFGNRMFEEHGGQEHKHVYISQKMRELGRLLIQIKAMNLKCLENCFDPRNWDVLILAVNGVAGFNKETGEYKTPSLALKLGHSLKKCAEHLRFEALKQENDEIMTKSEKFLEMYEIDWYKSVSSKALATLQKMRYNVPQILPTVADVVSLNNFLKDSAVKLCNMSSAEFYPAFAKVCLSQIILFNRKRSGEAERMTLKGFIEGERGGKIDPVVKSTLSEFEQKLCESHMRIEIVGKRGRKVPVLLTEEMKRNVTCLVSLREEAGVTNNEYLFARPGNCVNPYRGSDCLRNLALDSGIEHPETITSTKLRKQLATLAQILNLNENSQDILATFQGHDIRVHRKFYRLPEDALQVAKVSKLLHCVNSGTVGQYKGCDFDDIEFNENDTFDPESDASDCEDNDEDLEWDDNDKVTSNTESEETSQCKSDERISKVNLSPKADNTKQSKAKPVRRQWTSKEKECIKRHFAEAIRTLKVPGKRECLSAIQKNKLLATLDWKKIKYAVYNIISERKRRLPKVIIKKGNSDEKCV